MVDLIVYDREYNAIGIIDTENTLIWERRFYDSGYFEIRVPATDNNNMLLKQGYYIMRADAQESGYIQYLRKETNSEGVAEITAIGRFLSYILHGHIARGTRTFQGNAETIMRSLVAETATSDGIPNLMLGDTVGTSGTVDVVLEYPDILDALKEISRQSGVGFKITLKPETKKIYFSCISGADKSVNQIQNGRVIFSPEYDTVIGNATYVEDDTTAVNVVTMRYSSDNGEIVTRYNPYDVTGRDIHEIYATSSECVSENNVIDRQATEQLLIEKSKELLSEKKISFEAAVSDTGGYKYKEDYDIGDIVTLQVPIFGVESTQRIHKIVENYTESGKEIIPVCGEINPKGEDI